MSNQNQHQLHFSAADWGRIEEIFAVQTFVPSALPTDPLIIVDDSSSDDDETIILDNQSHRSRTSTVTPAVLDWLMSDGDIDEYIANPASHPEFTHDFYNEVHWPNVIAVSNYIRDIQRPEGLNGRTYHPSQPANMEPITNLVPETSLRQEYLLPLLDTLIIIFTCYFLFSFSVCYNIIFIFICLFLVWFFKKLSQHLMLV